MLACSDLLYCSDELSRFVVFFSSYGVKHQFSTVVASKLALTHLADITYKYRLLIEWFLLVTLAF
jgi:hypothetical protein